MRPIYDRPESPQAALRVPTRRPYATNPSFCLHAPAAPRQIVLFLLLFTCWQLAHRLDPGSLDSKAKAEYSEACPALPCPALPCPSLPCPALPCPDAVRHSAGLGK